MSSLSQDIFNQYRVRLEGEWPETALSTFHSACDSLFYVLLPRAENIHWIKDWVIRAENIRQLGLTAKGWIKFNAPYLTPWTVVHEFGHAWDYGFGLSLSARMRRFTQSRGPIPLLHSLWPANEKFWYRPGSLPPPCGKDGNFNRLEDFAEAVAAYVFPEEASKRASERNMGYAQFGYESFYATPRGRFIRDLIQNGG